MGLLAVKDCSIRIEDAVHYITSEIDNMFETNVLPFSKLTDVPYQLLDAEYLLFENSIKSNEGNDVIKVIDVDKILYSLVVKHKNGMNIKSIKINNAFVLLIKQIINFS